MRWVDELGLKAIHGVGGMCDVHRTGAWKRATPLGVEALTGQRKDHLKLSRKLKNQT